MHIVGKDCGTRTLRLLHDHDQDQLYPAEMHDLFSALLSGGFSELGGSAPV